MAETLYAWSQFYLGGESKDARDGRKIVINRKVIPFGEKVTPQKLEVDKDTFDAYKRSGVVRDYPPPEGFDENYPGSPVEFVREKIQQAVEEAEESANAENDVLLRSYATGAMFALPVELAGEPPLPEGVEEGKDES